MDPNAELNEYVLPASRLLSFSSANRHEVVISNIELSFQPHQGISNL
jgi:hypothetical protein